MKKQMNEHTPLTEYKRGMNKHDKKKLNEQNNMNEQTLTEWTNNVDGTKITEYNTR